MVSETPKLRLAGDNLVDAETFNTLATLAQEKKRLRRRTGHLIPNYPAKGTCTTVSVLESATPHIEDQKYCVYETSFSTDRPTKESVESVTVYEVDANRSVTFSAVYDQRNMVPAGDGERTPSVTVLSAEQSTAKLESIAQHNDLELQQA